MKPTLIVLAAGMASRYGSLKQMDGVGPNNEAIIDYSIYDAIQAGFGKVVFVIRHVFEENFKTMFSEDRFGGKIKVEFVFQELDHLPEGYSVPAGREKPWGTNHAVMMASNVVDTPFAVINADDFYGREAYESMVNYLQTLGDSEGNYSMVGYKLNNTLSDYGTVSRGVCEVDNCDNLTSMNERTAIRRINEDLKDPLGNLIPKGSVVYEDTNGLTPLNENSAVSMNFFGFTPDYFYESEILFKSFLDDKKNIENTKSEFFIPLVVDTLISQGKASMKVLKSDSKWFGVTYKEDREDVVSKIHSLITNGVYPNKLWE